MLYDENALEKIKKIKLFQEMGFSIKQIIELDHASNSKLKIELINRMNALMKEKRSIGNIIYIIQEMIDKL